MKFSEYKISDDIKRNLDQLGFKKPTDIQFKAIPSIMNGEDVLAVAQTGTGKTAAFAIPIIDKIHSRKSSKRSNGIKCIVMVPTRELAMQIGGVFAKLAKHTRVQTFALYGGVEQDAQIRKLQDGIDVVVATPGRMFDLISQRYLNLNYVDTLILDEADYMLALGFIDDIKNVKKFITHRHQTLFFSATISPEIKKLASSQIKNNAIRIQISPDNPVSKNVSHYVMFVEMDDKRFYLEKFIKDNPTSKIIIFVRTKIRAERVAKAMKRVDIQTYTLHGDKDQSKRTYVMKKFSEGKCNVMIATDVSARGIDIPDVEYVVNYDLPQKTENYVHRVGRTGRGINKGMAISFCSKEETTLLDEIQSFLNKKIDIIEVDKNEHSELISPQEENICLQSLLDEHEDWQQGKKKKRRNKKQK